MGSGLVASVLEVGVSDKVEPSPGAQDADDQPKPAFLAATTWATRLSQRTRRASARTPTSSHA